MFYSIIACSFIFIVFLLFKHSNQVTTINKLQQEIGQFEEMKIQLSQKVKDLEQSSKELQLQMQLDQAHFSEEMERLQEENEELSLKVNRNLNTLFGNEYEMRVDPEIPKPLINTIQKYIDAVIGHDYNQLLTTLDPVLLENRGYLGLWDQRADVKTVLRLEHDPEQRADGIKDEFGITVGVDLVKLYYLDADHDVHDINLILKEAGEGWMIFRFDKFRDMNLEKTNGILTVERH